MTKLTYRLAAPALMALAAPAFAEGPAVPTFTNETATAGLSTTYEGDWEFVVGGGVATFDCSGDRKPEVFLSGGAGASALYLNQSPVGGALRFKKTDAVTLDRVTGAYPLDIDSDGNIDLVVLRSGPNKVLRGLGNCRFEDATAAWGLDGGDAWSTSFAAIWEKGQTWPTLAIGNYVDRKEEAFPWGTCTDNWLHRPDGNTFAPPIALKPSYCPLSMLFTDWDNTGSPSLRVSNDREYYMGGQEQMWHLEAGAAPRLYTMEADGWKKLRIWGMGIAAADVNQDGYQDYYLTSMADQKLQVLTDTTTGKPDFADIAYKRGVTAHIPYTGGDERPSTGWHSQFADVNNDGRLDLFVTKGNVDSMPDFAANDPNNLLLGQADGMFVEVGDKASVDSMNTGRGAQVVDLNLDGKLDIVVVNRWVPAEIWRQTGAAGGNWVEVRLQQDGTNRDAIGSVIEVKRGDKVERHEVSSGGGHASGSVGWLHFGLGAADAAEMRVVWPDAGNGAKVSNWQSLPAGSFQILRPDAQPEGWQPG